MNSEAARDRKLKSSSYASLNRTTSSITLAATATYRLCIESKVAPLSATYPVDDSDNSLATQKPIGEESRRIISFPSCFWGDSLPKTLGATKKPQDYCLNWKLEVDPFPLTSPTQQGHFFGQGPITIESMELSYNNNDLSESMGGLKVEDKTSCTSADNNGNSQESSFVPFMTGKSEISKGVIHLFRELPNVPADILLDSDDEEEDSPQFWDDDSENEEEDDLILVDGQGAQETLKDNFATSSLKKTYKGEKMHIYRQLTSPTDDSSSLGVVYDFMDLSVVLILAIPAHYSPSDLLHFMGKDHVKRISKIRLLRDAAPNRFMALIKFVNNRSARMFVTEKDGVNYSPLEPEVCHVVFVKSVEFSTRASILEPLFDETEYVGRHPQSAPTMESIEFLEIPTCPVCLEKIDSTATGIMIVICNHKFHCKCLSRWGDGRCPVCRFSLGKSKSMQKSSCSVCGSTSNIWVCLICGNVGCGRYERGHANNHYCETGHNFALELESHRVWDYLGDNYVHRIIQNTEDGKLVELPGPDQTTSLESDATYKPNTDPDYYASLLVAQLESQRIFYEDKLDILEDGFMNRIKKMEKDHVNGLNQLSSELAASRESINRLSRQFEHRKEQLESRISALQIEKEKLLMEIASEKSLSQQAVRNTEEFNQIISEKDAEIQMLREQVKDLMLHIEAQQKLDEMSRKGDSFAEGGTIFLGSQIQSGPKKHSRRKHQ